MTTARISKKQAEEALALCRSWSYELQGMSTEAQDVFLAALLAEKQHRRFGKRLCEAGYRFSAQDAAHYFVARCYWEAKFFPVTDSGGLRDDYRIAHSSLRSWKRRKADSYLRHFRVSSSKAFRALYEHVARKNRAIGEKRYSLASFPDYSGIFPAER